jgi:hypothetical protein
VQRLGNCTSHNSLEHQRFSYKYLSKVQHIKNFSRKASQESLQSKPFSWKALRIRCLYHENFTSKPFTQSLNSSNNFSIKLLCQSLHPSESQLCTYIFLLSIKQGELLVATFICLKKRHSYCLTHKQLMNMDWTIDKVSHCVEMKDMECVFWDWLPAFKFF